jgi:hypothetical protein
MACGFLETAVLAEIRRFSRCAAMWFSARTRKARPSPVPLPGLRFRRPVLSVDCVLAAWAIGHTGCFAAAGRGAGCRLDRMGRQFARRRPPRRPLEGRPAVAHPPIYFARKFETPAAAPTGDPDPQSAELYNALRARKVDAAPVCMRVTSRPGDRALELETILGWLCSKLPAPPAPCRWQRYEANGIKAVRTAPPRSRLSLGTLRTSTPRFHALATTAMNLSTFMSCTPW